MRYPPIPRWFFVIQAAAGYVTQQRAVRDGRSRLWLSLTPEGTRAYRGHVRALQEIVAADAG